MAASWVSTTKSWRIKISPCPPVCCQNLVKSNLDSLSKPDGAAMMAVAKAKIVAAMNFMVERKGLFCFGA
jgi:hypothetical protein